MSLWPHFLAHLELLSVGLELGRGPVMHRSLSRIRQVAPMSTPSTAWFLGRTTVSPDRLSRFAGSTSVPNKTVPLSDLTNPPLTPPQKKCLPYIFNNSVENEPTGMIFGTQNLEEILRNCF